MKSLIKYTTMKPKCDKDSSFSMESCKRRMTFFPLLDNYRNKTLMMTCGIIW